MDRPPTEVPAAPAPAASTVAAPGFRFLLGSSTVAALGGSISSVAVSWLVYHATGSTLDVAAVGLTGIVPGIVFGLFAGVLADRYNRRRLMMSADIVRAFAMAGLAAALYLAGFSLLLVLGVMTVVYTFTALFTPASQAMLPRIVDAAHLEDANGILSASSQTASTIGAGVGGLLIVTAGPALGLGINAATYALSAILLFQIAVGLGRPRDAPTGRPRSVPREMGEGMRYMREHRPLLEITLGFLPANFLATMVLSFLVVYSAVILGPSALYFGYLEAALSGSIAVGALLVGRIRARRFAGLLMGAAVLADAGGIGLLALGRDLPVALLGVAVLGLNIGLINTVYYSTVQAIVPNDLLARVLSIDSTGTFVAIPAGIVVGGVLADTHGIVVTYAIAGLGTLANGVALLALKGVRTLRYTG